MPSAVVAADVNGDGWPDLITANRQANSMSVLTNNRSGGFSEMATLPVGSAPVSVAARDLNGDGGIDLVSANDTGHSLSVYQNNASLDTAFVGDGAGLTSLNAGNVTGTLGAAQIPDLDASKITTGTLDQARIPSLDAAKIATGTLDDAHLSANVALLNRSPQTFTGENNFSGHVGIGTTTPGARLDIASSTQLSERLRLSGQEFYQSGNTDTEGLSLLLGVNRMDNRQLWIADSGRLAVNSTNPVLRMLVSDHAAIDSVATDGTTPLPLSLGPNGSLVLAANGHVGIGTTNPTHALTVVSDSATYVNPVVRVQSQNTGVGGSSAIGFFDATGVQKAWVGLSTGTGLIGGQGGLQIYTGSGQSIALGDDDGAVHLVLDGANDSVGIGTDTPTKAKVEINGWQGATLSYGYLNADGNTGAASGDNRYSLYASDRIAATEFNAFSDARIKNIQGPSDGATDLQTLLGIQITDYTYKDTIAKGTRPQKKVIAQQVEKVYPQAVSRSTDEVPDIYQRAPVKDGWVQLATDLKVGERVKLIGEKEQGVYPVLEVRDGAFRTDFKPKGDKVFVFGRQVDDFRTVDYEAIAMLNVSATQEIYRELTALKAENAELKQKVGRIDELAQKNAAMESRLVALEKLITRQHLALNEGAK
ncbi:MAG TPA: FG-GAP-like repeat-containing protein [Verrucomicrobiae bacterium]|nr:FG-GAP-like repeat-containing protein [Verrucomicrobiae bacterium]